MPPPRLPDTPDAVCDQRDADLLGPQGTPSDMGQLAVWGPPDMTPQNQVTHSRLGQMSPWSGTGYMGPMARSVQRASGLLDEMSRQEAADREKLKRREEERQASKQALDSYLIGDHMEKLLARCTAMPSARLHHDAGRIVKTLGGQDHIKKLLARCNACPLAPLHCETRKDHQTNGPRHLAFSYILQCMANGRS